MCVGVCVAVGAGIGVCVCQGCCGEFVADARRPVRCLLNNTLWRALFGCVCVCVGVQYFSK